uniref:Mitoc_mL59 domain-containing protein n=1 Tax=Heligmosomoides polygyrus TaxID=6339 RepID=A0A183FJT1_HELPZ
LLFLTKRLSLAPSIIAKTWPLIWNSGPAKSFEPPKGDSRKKKDAKDESRKLLPYPEVKPPTASQKKRRIIELEKEKREKIASGFYQVSIERDHHATLPDQVRVSDSKRRKD